MLKFDPHQVKLYQPPASSHKGQNGKLLVIGGSKLFHSSIFWAADVASRIVDIVHFTSPANENNTLVRRKIKQKFWNGIVVDWADVENYIEEDDAILIGPGMIRNEPPSVIPARFAEASARRANAGIYTDNLYRFRLIGRNDNESGTTMKTAAKYDSTSFIVNFLLKKYPSKRWVLDGGGLQEVEPGLITQSCILTPHRKEFLNLTDKCYKNYKNYNCGDLSQKLRNCTILLKGPVDTVCQDNRCVEIPGGNPGMTKGGTGDVLAGLVAALYCKNDAWTAATVSSWVNKTAGDELYKKVGPYFNATDLVEEIPKVLAKFAKPAASHEVSQTSSSAYHKFTR